MPEHESSAPRALAVLVAPALFVLGVGLQLYQASLWTMAAYLGLGLSALVVLAARPAMRTASARSPRQGARLSADALFWIAVLAVGFAWAGFRAGLNAQDRLAPDLEGIDLDVLGVVSALPQRHEAGVRFRLRVESARDPSGRAVNLPDHILLGWYTGWGVGERGAATPARQPLELRPGERWQLRVRLKAPHGGVNPHGFDYELWLWEQGLGATGYVRAGPREPTPQRLASAWAYPVQTARWQVREWIFERVSDFRAAGILAALVVGDQAAIDRTDWEVFRATGVAHLMAISGLHVTMFAWMASGLVGALWRKNACLCLMLPSSSAGLIVGLALATGYAVFAGWGVPAQRTVLMLAVVGGLALSGRRWPWPASWLAACVAVLIWDPWALLQAGFWLSFVAVGVLFASGRAEAGAWSDVSGLFAKFKALLGEQLLIGLALAPLSLMLFGQVSLVGLLANVFAIPWVTLVVTPLGLLGVLIAPAWDIAALALRALGAVLEPVSQWPWAVWSGATPALWATALGVLGGALTALKLPLALRLCGLLALWPALTWSPLRPAAGEFELMAWDVGQGNAVLVRTHSHSLLFDAGPRYSRETDAGHRVLVPGLRALGERIDLLVASHRDSDHTGGAPAVLAQQPQAQLLASLPAEHELWRRAGAGAKPCLAGQRWAWDGVEFEILHPDESDVSGSKKPNTVSCVLRVQAKSGSALLSGDIEVAQEARLVEAGLVRQSDLLLVPHHGSKTSSSAAFLDAVAPRLAVVQAGYRNRFGHPAPEVLARYAARGIRTEDSAHCGALRWRSDDVHAVHCLRLDAPRYWRHQPP